MRRRDRRSIRNAVGVRCPAATLAIRVRRAGDVARRQCHRETQLETAIFVAKIFQVFDFHDDQLARCDVGHLCRKQVGAMLLHETGFLACSLCLFILFLRPFLFTDLSLDVPITDVKPQTIDGSLVRERKDVDPLGPVAALVAELLPDRDPRDESVDAHLDGRVDRRCRCIALFHAPEKAAGLHLLRCDVLCFRGPGPQYEEQRQHPEPGSNIGFADLHCGLPCFDVY